MILRFKAMFLILIFGANTLIGFCCSIGMNMSFSLSSNKQICSVKNTHPKIKEHKRSKVFSDKKDALNKGNCCNGRVVILAQTDKSLAESPVLVHPVIFTSFICAFLNYTRSLSCQLNISENYFLKNHPPPIPDIRIAIRSFQI